MLALVTILGCLVVGLAAFYLISEISLAILEYMFNVDDEVMAYRIIGGIIFAIILLFSIIPEIP